MKNDLRHTSGLLAVPMALWGMAFVGVSLLYIVGLSLLTRGAAFEVKLPLTLDNYAKLFDMNYLKVLGLSLRLAALTAALSFVIGYPFGYFMARSKPKTRTWLLLLVIVPFWTNALIRIYGWKLLLSASGPVNRVLLSLGMIDRPLKLLYTEGAVLVGMVYAMIPFMILPVYSGVERMDWSVVEAARDLGAGPFRAFLTTTLRMTLPSILAGLVLTFIPSIGLFFLSDLLGGSNTALFGNIVHDQLYKSYDLPFASALSVVMLLLTGGVIALYRKSGGKTESMVF